jgi:pseudaminic acid biosynthesis-associated methylase
LGVNLLDQVKTFWTAPKGDAYVDRNKHNERTHKSLCLMWQRILASTYPAYPQQALEVGANVGRNLRALAIIKPACKLHAVEPNERALDELKTMPFIHPDRCHNATADALPYPDQSIDLVFTSGVLIHIPPHELEEAMEEMHRVARNWIVAIEYFAPDVEMVRYQGEDNRLWRNDYGRLWAEKFKMKPVACGFEWKALTHLDNLTWWLLRK